MNKLSKEQCQFFLQLSAIAFSNPFSKNLQQLECRILGLKQGQMTAPHRQVELLKRTRFHFQKLHKDGLFKLSFVEQKHQEMMQIVWLYWLFREVQEDFDQMIERQRCEGNVPVYLPSAKTIIARFLQTGFDEIETAKYIALFYQLRRAFNFISQSVAGDCEAIEELRMRLWNNIFTYQLEWYLKYLYEKMEDFSTLLLGETGTGKSLIAKAIGCSGFIPFDMKKQCFKESYMRSFQACNLSQYPSSLLESELFGHKKGAFTGAIDNHQGLFARCNRYGAVFIDEIGDIDISTQLKLLTVMQDRVFSAVGSHEQLRFHGRVISATNQDIIALRKAGKFRHDLYYRLCSDVIVIPRLQQRINENPYELRMLITRLLDRVLINSDQNLVERVEKRINDSIPPDYEWPGNVRELEQGIRRICLTGSYEGDMCLVTQNSGKIQQAIESEKFSAQQLIQIYCSRLYQAYGSYEAVARIVKLDRRTVRKYIVAQENLTELEKV